MGGLIGIENHNGGGIGQVYDNAVIENNNGGWIKRVCDTAIIKNNNSGTVYEVEHNAIINISGGVVYHKSEETNITINTAYGSSTEEVLLVVPPKVVTMVEQLLLFRHATTLLNGLKTFFQLKQRENMQFYIKQLVNGMENIIRITMRILNILLEKKKLMKLIRM